MRDNRIALRNGYEIEVASNKRIRINAEVGRGASCIVYDAVYKDSIGAMHNIRVKECYPAYLLMDRMKEGVLTPLNLNGGKFETAKEHFIQAYERNVAIGNTLGLTNSTINSADIVQYNNTYYIVMSLNEGSDYRKYEDQSLMELLMHIKSLAELIKKYHDNGYLHLDIKPENIFILPETEEHILLFDFDSVILKDDLAKNGRLRLSFSEGFSAPEQVQGEINNIDYHTDIFSIGALLFYKLFDKKPTLDECRISFTYNYEQMRFFKKEYQPKLYKVLGRFLKKTLSASVIPRWNDMQQLIDCLDELISLSDADGRYLIDSFQYNLACFIGRETEIGKIHRVLENNQLVFLSGIGGIGKTEIVKQYAKRYRDQYDTILFSVFDNDIVSLVNNEIMINRVEKDESENEAEYFDRKIDILKHIVTDKDLIIIDNFDVDSDDKLESLFCCPCKFIITSRMDFRDYNYEQIDVDRMENIEDVLQLFYTYNDEIYNTEDAAAVGKLVKYVDYHTMTVELISKYLRVSGEAPTDLFNRFIEKDGTVNTRDVSVKQRKDRQLRSESVNNHLGILFDVSGFDETEKEIIGSLSLYAGIRIRKDKFEEICAMDNISEKLDKLIKRGWIEYNEGAGKISLHQVIQDLVYKNLSPCAENCPNIIARMCRYITDDTSRIKHRVMDVFMNRITGAGIPYARLCMLYGGKEKLGEAKQICLGQEDKEAYDVLQRIYRKEIGIIYYDMFESELELDDYISDKVKLIEELLDKVIFYCRKYTDDSNYIIKEYIEVVRQIDNNFSDNLVDVSNVYRDRINYKIIDMYDVVMELLPKSSYMVNEKEKYYMTIRDFYSGTYFNDVIIEKSTYFYFFDVEKAYLCQERINELRKNMNGKSVDMVIIDAGVSYYPNDVSYYILSAEKYEKERNYEKAIEAYKKAYEEGHKTYESTMRSIADIYLKTGESEKAIEYLEKALDYNKENEKNTDVYFSYSSYTCMTLIKNMVKLQDFERAKTYALELIHYEEPKLLKEANLYAVQYVLEAYYYLYFVESDNKKKESLWQQCINCYKMLGNNKIDDDIFDFIVEYLVMEDVSFDEILVILDRIGDWNTKDIKEKIILSAIDKSVKSVGFEKYHVILMIEYARLFNEYPNPSSKEAEGRYDEAQRLYVEYGLNDEYIQSLLYNTKAKIMLRKDDYEYDEVLEFQKKCNYGIMAEHQLKLAADDRKKIEIWRDAADSYRNVSNYKMQTDCLEKALEILIPSLNLYEFNTYEYIKLESGYWHMMEDIIRAYIMLEDFQMAKKNIDEFYKKVMEFYLMPENSDDAQMRISKIQSIADFYVEITLKEDAVNTYLTAMYMGLEKDINKYNILKEHVSDIDPCRLNESITSLLDKGIDNRIVDSLIDLKDKLVSYRDAYRWDIRIYDEIISKINDCYQNRDIEFKK